MDDVTAGLAAASGVKASLLQTQVGIKLFKQDEAAKAAVMTMATSLPENPNLGRNVNTSA